MIYITKNNKWVFAALITCILLGTLTFYTFINRSFIQLNDFNLQFLLIIDVILLKLFFALILAQLFKAYKQRQKGNLGSKTSLRYILFFSTTTLLPSILIAIFSLFLFNVLIQNYFTKKIKTIVNGSAELGKNYVEQSRNSVEADILLMVSDINNNSNLFYDNPSRFQNLIFTQRLLRKLDEVHLLDSSGNIIMSNIADNKVSFIRPPEEAFVLAAGKKAVAISDSNSQRTSALIKLNNFIDTYLYIVKFMDPKVVNYLKQTGEAINFYFTIQDKKTGLKITFAIIYVLIVSLLLFVSVIIAINFSSRLTKPIVNLINASEKISTGNLTVKVPNIDTDDEFKKLNENFNSMIEKLKKQQDKLILSERHSAWESVARKLAHEIKNPLTPIQLSIDQIKEKYLHKIASDKKNFSIYLDTINKQIKDIENLVNEFSDFARMPKPNLKVIDINKIILQAFELNKLAIPKIKFSISQNKTSNSIMGDEEQLNRVFLNLIKNSIESIEEKVNKNVDYKGKITIDIKDDSYYIYVTITDNGVGFEHIDKSKMLKPYFTTKKKGTGLGLAVVTKILNDHNSSILFTSIDNGARVDISIPIA